MSKLVRSEFPMHVGMNRTSGPSRSLRSRVPHARGDEPALAPITEALKSSSPCTWG